MRMIFGLVYSTSCPACIQFKPIFDALVKTSQYKSYKFQQTIQLDCGDDAFSVTAAKIHPHLHQVNAIPTIFIINENNGKLFQQSGAISQEQVFQWITKIIGSDQQGGSIHSGKGSKRKGNGKGNGKRKRKRTNVKRCTTRHSTKSRKSQRAKKLA